MLNLVASTPIGIIFTVILLYDLLGWASFVGEGLVIVTMILPGMMLRYYHKLLRQQRKAVDARIGLMVNSFFAQSMISTYNSFRQKHLGPLGLLNSLVWRGFF